jgi:hypothetical protein
VAVGTFNLVTLSSDDLPQSAEHVERYADLPLDARQVLDMSAAWPRPSRVDGCGQTNSRRLDPDLGARPGQPDHALHPTLADPGVSAQRPVGRSGPANFSHRARCPGSRPGSAGVPVTDFLSAGASGRAENGTDRVTRPAQSATSADRVLSVRPIYAMGYQPDWRSDR